MAIHPDFNKVSIKGKISRHEQEEEKNRLDYYSEGFESKSKKTVRVKKVDITQYHIERWSGGKVTHLRQGNRYRLVYHVHFHERLRLIDFGAWFYSSKSKLISGFTLPGERKPIDEITKNSIYKISAGFTCHFNRGVYGLKLLVRGEVNHVVVPICTEHDALIFQVLDDNEEVSQGFVKVLDEWELEEH